MCKQPHHPATCITKTDPARLDGTEGEVTGSRAATKFPASKFNYILTVWKLQKCWPLGEFDGMQSHCIEYVLLLYTALRLVGGWAESLRAGAFSVGSFLFLFPLLMADVSHRGGVNLPHKGGACLPRGHRLFMYQIYFLLPWPPRIHTAFITGG